MGHNTEYVQLLIEARRVGDGRGALVRRQAGLSQAEVARFLGVSTSAVSHWENGRRAPRGDAAIRYARLLRHIEREVTA